MKQKSFVLVSDYGHINQIETTAKSIIYHHSKTKIYIVNEDIPQEWFNNINKHLRQVDSQIINTRIDQSIVTSEHTLRSKTDETFYERILIPGSFDDEQVLYLESDVIVDQDLSELFELELADHPIAAVPDLLYDDCFDPGVLLLNMPVLKKYSDIITKILKIGIDKELTEKARALLNEAFNSTYLKLPLKYNLAIGYDFLCYYYPSYDHGYWDKTDIKGSIIHYTGFSKPWDQLSTSRYRSKWWQYHDLSWSEVCQHAHIPSTLGYQENGRSFTMTDSENVKDLERLVRALPNWTFNIAAYTNMGENLIKLICYPNVHLYPAIIGTIRDQLIDEADCYLDINYGTKNEAILEKFQKTGKPIISFDEVNSIFKDAVNYQSFSDTDVSGMINYLKKLQAETTVHSDQLAIDLPKQLSERSNADFSSLFRPAKYDLRVMDSEDTLMYIRKHQCSVSRFGDGEIALLNGVDQVFQQADPALNKRLNEIVQAGSSSELLVCLSDVFHGLDMLVDPARDWWQGHLITFADYYRELGKKENIYGNTMVTRPYIDFKDRTAADRIFKQLKELWTDRDLLIVEGHFTRSGVGNDLFSNARSLQRIICPSKNAWTKYQEIEDAIKLYGKERLVLVMLGMTASVIAADLAGFTQVIDLGHLDPEYEWYKMGAKTRVPIEGKHTAEMNYDIDISEVHDQKYQAEIIKKIGI